MHEGQVTGKEPRRKAGKYFAKLPWDIPTDLPLPTNLTNAS
jgi:hypothetical protein